MPTVRNRKNTLSSWPNPASNQFPDPFVYNRNPTTRDEGEIGQEWVNSLNNTAFILTSRLLGQNIWTAIANPNIGVTFNAQTVNAVETPLVAFNIPINSAIDFFVEIIAASADFTVSGGGTMTQSFGRAGAGAFFTSALVRNFGSNGGLAVNMGLVGNQVVITGTGLNATVINWKINITSISLP